MAGNNKIIQISEAKMFEYVCLNLFDKKNSISYHPIEFMDVLLKKFGFNINWRGGNYYNTLLYRAIQAHDEELANYLLAKGASVDVRVGERGAKRSTTLYEGAKNYNMPKLLENIEKRLPIARDGFKTWEAFERTLDDRERGVVEEVSDQRFIEIEEEFLTNLMYELEDNLQMEIYKFVRDTAEREDRMDK